MSKVTVEYCLPIICACLVISNTLFLFLSVHINKRKFEVNHPCFNLEEIIWYIVDLIPQCYTMSQLDIKAYTSDSLTQCHEIFTRIPDINKKNISASFQRKIKHETEQFNYVRQLVPSNTAFSFTAQNLASLISRTDHASRLGAQFGCGQWCSKRQGRWCRLPHHKGFGPKKLGRLKFQCQQIS